jgi:hypothetical protein
MGLSIHYSGHIKKVQLIDALIAEVVDICKTLDWKYNILHDENIDGIVFSPPESEPVHLTFNKEGRLLPFTSILTKDMYESGEVEKELMFTAFTKTQFAGPDAHKAIIKLIRYITQKYFSEFRLEDESYYWETNDERQMVERFKVYNAMLDVFTEALQGMEHVPGETPQSLAGRLEELLRTKFKDVDFRRVEGETDKDKDDN